ncbi:MAG: FecR domain-containing protein [Spartobacteria bacterium]
MKTTAFPLACFVAVLGFFSLAMPLAAGLPEAGEVRVREARGNPAEIIMPDGSRPVVRVNDAIPQGAVLKTPRNSFLSLLFANGSLLDMKPLSELRVTGFTSAAPLDFEKADSNRSGGEPCRSSTRLDLKSGLIMLDIPRLKPDSHFQISTSLGTTGIRGTQLYVLAQKDRGAVGVATGRVVATSITGQTQSLAPGEAVVFTLNGFASPGVAEKNLIRELESAFESGRAKPIVTPPVLRKPVPQTTAPRSSATYQTSE